MLSVINQSVSATQPRFLVCRMRQTNTPILVAVDKVYCAWIGSDSDGATALIVSYEYGQLQSAIVNERPSDAQLSKMWDEAQKNRAIEELR